MSLMYNELFSLVEDFQKWMEEEAEKLNMNIDQIQSLIKEILQ